MITKKHGRIFWTALAAMAIGIMGVPPAITAKQLVKVTIAEGMQPSVAPIYVAYHKGYWKEQGLDVHLKSFLTGKQCCDAMLAGKADAGTMAPTPPAIAAFKGSSVRLITVIESTNNHLKVLVRKDQGIKKPSDLVGTTVACTFKTNGQFFMNAFLKSKGVDIKNLRVVDLSPSEMTTAIIQGKVQAIFTWEPHIILTKEMLGNEAEVWLGGDIYIQDFYLGVEEGFIQKYPHAVTGLLKGLIKAEKFIKENPAAAIVITAPHVKMRTLELQTIWKDYHFKISLEKDHLDRLTKEGRRAQDYGIVPLNVPLPDFGKLFYPKPLAEIDPTRVRLDSIPISIEGR
ncbi:MAG: NrtA/SsuA/CpmA family ABC transporter substrate-binding protein [Nitrospirota bacterium]